MPMGVGNRFRPHRKRRRPFTRTQASVPACFPLNIANAKERFDISCAVDDGNDFNTIAQRKIENYVAASGRTSEIRPEIVASFAKIGLRGKQIEFVMDGINLRRSLSGLVFFNADVVPDGLEISFTPLRQANPAHRPAFWAS